jgi:hypothetical protein
MTLSLAKRKGNYSNPNVYIFLVSQKTLGLHFVVPSSALGPLK